MCDQWPVYTVAELQHDGFLRVEDGNHGEYRPRPAEFEETGVSFIRAADMDDGRVLFERASRINDVALQRIRKGIGAPGDVLVSHKGTVGKVAFVPLGAEPFVCSPQTTFWRSLDQSVIDRRYLYFYLCSEGFQRQLASVKGESDMADYVSLSVQRTLKVALPPVSEQRAIAHILGTLDDKIELNRRMNATLEEMARALFKSWFVDFDPVRAKAAGRQPAGMDAATAAIFPDSFEDSELGEIPRGWEVKPLSEAFDVNPPRQLKRGTIAPYLDMASMPTSTARATNIVDRAFGSGMRFVNGDTLVARITPCLENGKTAFVDFLGDNQVGWGSTEYIVLRPKPPMPVEFAYFLARTDAFRSFAVSNMTGTSGRQRVSPSAFDHYAVVVPPPPVAAEFGASVRDAFGVMKANDQQSGSLVEAREVLVPALMSGAVRIAEYAQDRKRLIPRIGPCRRSTSVASSLD